MSPSHRSLIGPLRLANWYLLEGFIPIGVRHVERAGVRYIEQTFMKTDTDGYDTFITTSDHEQGMYPRVRDLFAFWDEKD